jgi:hypothetical protein
MPSKTFYNDLMNVISTFRSRYRHVILRRLGFYGYCDSLKLIGKDLSVTRERVRQIEVVCLRAINKNCGAALNDKLKKCLKNRKTTIYLDLLEVENEWFYGFSDKPVFLTRTIEKLSKYHVFEIKERQVITQIHLEQWNNLKSETLAYFKLQTTKKLSQKEVKQQIRRLASEKGSPDLTDSLQEFLKDKLHFASPKGKGAKELCSVGRGLSNILEAQLLEMKKPLHYIELARRCSAQVGRHVEGYVHNSLKDLAYLYGRGIYGTLQHFPLDEKNKKKILAITENIIRQGPATRQWTCSELLLILKEGKSNLPDKLDKYILNIILIDSSILKSIGRLVWILKGKTEQCKVPRVDLQKAVLTIIEKAEKPLSIHEIKKIIMKKRGLDEHFTILPTAQIARTKPNTWGLVNRDFLVTKAQQNDILDSIYHKLKKCQEGLHITELKKSLFEAGIILHQDFTNYMALSLCQADHRLKVYRGQIVGLSIWRNAKRISIKMAIEQIAQNVHFPMTMSELRHSIEEIVKHDVKQPLHQILKKANFVRDEDSNTWYVL